MPLFESYKSFFKEKSVKDLLDIADEGMLQDLLLATQIDWILLKLKELKESEKEKKAESLVQNIWHTVGWGRKKIKS